VTQKISKNNHKTQRIQKSTKTAAKCNRFKKIYKNNTEKKFKKV